MAYILHLDRGAGDRRAPSGEKGGDVGYVRLEERMAMRLSGIHPGFQESRNSGIQESRNSGILEFMHQQIIHIVLYCSAVFAKQ